MSKTPNFDAKVKEILDNTHPGERMCGITGEAWKMDEEEISWYRKFNVPPSRYSQISRMRYLTSFFNGGQWWWNRHAETGKPIISAVHPATGIKLLSDKEWFDKDYSEIHRSYNPGIKFFDQLHNLRMEVPASASRDYEPAESSISVASFGDVNSYFMVACKAKDSLFGVVAHDTENSSEVYNSTSITDSYRVVHCERIHKSTFVQESFDCMNCDFIFDCRNCENCFASTNLRNRKFVWFNEQLTEEEWKKRRSKVDLGSRSVTNQYLEKFNELVRNAIWPENFNINSDDSTGEYLTNCGTSKYAYYGNGGAQNNFWVAWAIGNCEGNAFCADPGIQDCYYSAAASHSYNCKYCLWVTRCSDMEFSMDCYDCEHCFGCVGLRNKRFHILNKAYSEEEYWKKVDEIKSKMLDDGEYREFLPATFAHGWYPESGAVKYHLADLEFGKQIGAHMFNPEDAGAVGEDLMNAREVLSTEDIPDHVNDIDDWAGKPIYDANYDRRYSILPPEIAFYKRNSIAPPNEHFIQRVRSMIALANSGVFADSKCNKCEAEVLITINATFPNRKIYCKPCYLAYIEETN